MEQVLVEGLVFLATKYPWVLAIAVFMAGMRVINKPLFSILRTIAEQTESKKDDVLLDQVEASKIYKGFCWALDLLASVKLKVKGK